MSNVRIFDDHEHDKDLWTEYVQRHPLTTVDHCWQWRKILQGALRFKPYYLGAFHFHQLTGILPLFHVPRGFGRSALVSIPLGNYGGICADSPEVESLLLAEAKDLMKSLKCSYVELRHRTRVSSQELQFVDDRARFSMPIQGSPETIFANLKKNVRKKVNHSTKAGVTITSSRDTDALYKIHADKFRRLGTPCFPRAYFDLTLEHFAEDAVIYYAHYQDEIFAFKFCLFFRQSVSVIVGGNLEQHLNLHPNYILIWHIIEMAARGGFSEVDMCRSRRNSGPAKHKIYLGMREYPLGYQYLVSDKHRLALRNPSDSKFRMASRLWRKMPLRWTQVLGPKIVRYFA